MPDRPPQPSPAAHERDQLREELAAYLGGQLDPADAQRVEAQLTHDPVAAGELELLRRAWEALDELPAPMVPADFTRSTVAMVAVAASEAGVSARAPGRWGRGWIGAGVVALGALTGFGAVRLWPSPLDELQRDLPLVENLDAYRQAESLEFLRALRSAGLFVEEPAADASPAENN